MIWHYSKVLSSIKQQNSKQFKQTNYILKQLRGIRESEIAFDKKQEVVHAYASLIRAVYLLDFNIWNLVRQ